MPEIAVMKYSRKQQIENSRIKRRVNESVQENE